MGSSGGAPVFTGASFGIAASLPSETAAALRPVPGSPRLRLLRRLRPAPTRSANGGPGPTPRWLRGIGQDRDGSRVHCDSLDEGGVQLCPCGIATATPQHFTVASRPTSTCLPGSYPPTCLGVGTHRSRPLSTRFE